MASRLRDVDGAIVALAECPFGEIDDYFSRLGAAVLTYCDGSLSTVSGPSEVFEALDAKESRRFLAMCLLRVASRRADVFDDRDLRVPAVKLFDEVLPDVYNAVGVSRATQGHEKIDALADIFTHVDRELSQTLEAFEAAGDFRQARTNLLKVLRSKRVSPFIAPFVPRVLVDTMLDELLAALDETETADGEAKLLAYRTRSDCGGRVHSRGARGRNVLFTTSPRASR